MAFLEIMRREEITDRRRGGGRHGEEGRRREQMGGRCNALFMTDFRVRYHTVNFRRGEIAREGKQKRAVRCVINPATVRYRGCNASAARWRLSLANGKMLVLSVGRLFRIRGVG